MYYRVLNGLSWEKNGVDRRAEVGDVVNDLPAKSIKWLLTDGLIEPVKTPAKKAPVKPGPED